MLARKALAGTAGAAKEYVEDVFSTYLYSGTGSTINIVNGIDLSGDGGLVWTKSRSQTGSPHGIVDTARGRSKTLYANTTGSELTSGSTQDITSFNADGFSIGTEFNLNINNASHTYVSWTFRKAKKFFDVVTYTGNGTNPRNISHNLGSTPGCIVVKRTDTTGNWNVYHRSAAAGGFTAEQCYMYLNSTNAVSDNSTFWSDTAPTSTQFTVGSSSNANGGTYVAYLFAHDAGGFGDAGSDSIIKCGSYTGNGGTLTVDLGWEPQWLLVKRTDFTGNWALIDVMRGWIVGASSQQIVYANTSGAETGDSFFGPTATGFSANLGGTWNGNGGTYIYIAIRRGPMKTPTSGTSVFTPKTRTGTGSATTVTGISANVVDVVFTEPRVNGSGDQRTVWDRMRGASNYLVTTGSGTEANYTSGLSGFDVMNGYKYGSGDTLVNSAQTYVDFVFTRAPGFFDIVCFTGNGSFAARNHNLGVTPELVIQKARNGNVVWYVVRPNPVGKYSILNQTDAESSINFPATSTTIGVTGDTNGETYVVYLFASCPGVSKIGTYTGNGSSVTVTTDFQPRFIMVKRTDSTGNWIVSDSARGLVAGNDPYLLLNSTAAEDTDEDWVDVSSTGFTVNQTTAANANVNTGTYIYLAIA